LIVVERLVRVGEEMVEGEGMNCRHLPVPDRQTQTVRRCLKATERKICGKSQDKFFRNKLSTAKIPRLVFFQSTYIPRVPQCLSPRPNWDPPLPLQQASVPPPPRNQRGGGYTLACVRGSGGEAQFGRIKKSLAICLSCVLWSIPYPETLVLRYLKISSEKSQPSSNHIQLFCNFLTIKVRV
jgi:hypothetical protein